MSYVKLIDHMGSDNAICQAARISYEVSKSTDEQLIRYLMRNWHTSPFEMVEFKFHVKVPIFIARQWLRHRTASVNEISARYSVLQDGYWSPDVYRTQSLTNKQGSEDPLENISTIDADACCDKAFEVYHALLEKGVSRELARTHLPQSTYTQFIWKIDLHNLFHFLELRMDHHAQDEIKVLANDIFDLISPIVPFSCKAFLDYRVGSIRFSAAEIWALQNKGNTSRLSRGEIPEFNKKCFIILGHGANGDPSDVSN